MIRCVVAGIAAGCLATVLAGCGGSGHGASAGRDTSWAEQAEAICAQTEATIRQRAPAESSRDLERLMAAVVDDLRAGRSDLDALELPEDQRKKAETFLRDVDKVVKVAEKIRDARRDHVKIWMVSYDARVTALDLEEDARAAGLRRCGREASTKAVDAVMMPGYAQDVAKMILPIIALVEAAEQMPQPGHSEAYWKAVVGVIDPDGTGREP